MTTLTYARTNINGGTIDLGMLTQMIKDHASIDKTKILGLTDNGTSILVDVNPDLTSTEKNALDGDVGAPANDPPAVGSVLGDYAGETYTQTTGKSFKICKAFSASDGADIEIYGANSPKMRILDVTLKVSTLIASSTCTLRDAAAGGGNALSSALDSGTTGTKRDDASTATVLLAAGSSLYLNRSNTGTVGEVIIHAWMEA